MKNFVFSLLAIVTVLPFTGCQGEKGPKTVTAEGVVTLDGDPVEGAAVVFIDDKGVYPARGRTDETGRFSLDTFEYKPGAVPGSYKAIVTKTVVTQASEDPPKNDANAGEEAEHAADGGGMVESVRNSMPKKYSQPSADFAFVIPEDGTTELKLDLTSK